MFISTNDTGSVDDRLRIARRCLMAGSALLLLSPAAALAADDHVLLPAGGIEWSAGPASIPEGAEAAVLYGDPSTDGLFALRLKLPDGYHIPAHIHPKPEVVTVVSGNFRIGMGKDADAADAKDLKAGGFFAFPPGMVHYAYTEGETVIQLNSTGPWSLEYVNPEDDPRKQ